MMNKSSVLMMFSVLCLNLFAANIEWNRMKSVDAEVWDSGPVWMVWGSSETATSINPTLMVTISGNELIASQYMGGSCTIWSCQMNLGDVVGYETMNNPNLEYFYCGKSGVDEVTSNYNIKLKDGQTAYLGFSTEFGLWRGETLETYMLYGWVGIENGNGVPVVVGSAWDIDGGAMFVGGGAVPESSSGLLVLLGCAGLLLRRRGREEA